MLHLCEAFIVKNTAAATQNDVVPVALNPVTVDTLEQLIMGDERFESVNELSFRTSLMFQV